MGESTESIVKIVKSMGFEDVVADTYDSRMVYLKIVNSEVDSIVEKHNRSTNLFLAKKKKITYLGDIGDTSKRGIVENVKKGAKSLEGLKAKEDYFGIAEPGKKIKDIYSYDKKIENCGNDALADKAVSAINSAVENGATSVAGMIVIGSGTSHTSTSNGFDNDERSTFVRMSLRVFNKNISFQNVFASRMLSGIEFDKESKKAAQMVGGTKKIGKIENGKYDVIYMQSPGGSLLTNITSAACMTNAETGSCMTGKLNKEVAGKDLKIYDDGMIKEGTQSSTYDSEGTPSQSTVVIENGVLKNYLHNYSTAKKYNTKSTGNAGLIMPSSRTLVLKHKRSVKDIDDLMSEVKNGILVTNSWYTRFKSYVDGDFSTMPRDLAIYIKNGEPQYVIKQKDVGPIVGIRVSDNLLRMMKNMTLVAKDERQCASWDTEFECFFVPSMLIRDVSVTVV